jgi:hypothetical protein
MMMDTQFLYHQNSNDASLLNSYLDTQMKQSLQKNNEMVTTTKTSHFISNLSQPFSSSYQTIGSKKESFIDPIFAYSQSPLPNRPSFLPIIQDQSMKKGQSFSSTNLPFIPSSNSFTYKHRNKGKFRTKKNF